MSSCTNTLFVVLDASGSMYEMAKMRTAENLISYIRECLRLGIYDLPFSSIFIIACSGKTQTYSLANDEELPMLEPTGKLNVDELLKLLEAECSPHDSMQRVLFISDGNLSNSDLQKYLSWKDHNSYYHIRTVAVGLDADIYSLNEISTEGTVFTAEQISKAIKYWPLCKEQPVPVSIKDVVIIPENDEVEVWG